MRILRICLLRQFRFIYLITNKPTMGEPIHDTPLLPNVATSNGLPEGHDPFQPYKVEAFDDGLRYDTLQVHGGHRPDKETHARAVPIYNSVVSFTL